MRPFLSLALLAALLSWLVATELSFGLCVQEDSFISFRYALNLVNGHGLVFNPGEPPVEGYTNFLWTVIIAGAIQLGLDPVSFVRFAGMGLSLILVIAAFALARREHILWRERFEPTAVTAVEPESSSRRSLWPAGLLAAGVLAFSPAVAAESVQGLETIFFTLLTTLGVAWQAEGRHREAVGEPGAAVGYLGGAVLLAMAALTRPEGVLVMSLASAAGVLWRRRHGGPWLTGLEVAGALSFVAVFAPYWLWRFTYYGYPFPNTFYAKTGGGPDAAMRGVKYLWSFLAANPGLSLLSLVAIGAALLAVTRRSGDRVEGPSSQQPSAMSVMALTVVLGYGSYVAAVGGDFKSTFRFVIPFLPLWAILLDGFWLRSFPPEPRGDAGTGLRRWLGPAVSWAVLLAVILGGLVALPETVQWSRARATDLFYRTALGRQLAELAPGDAVLAIHSAGIIPYYSGLRTIDMWGLNDLHIAHRVMPKMGQGVAGHEKSDADYVFSRKPDYYVPEGYFVTLTPLRDMTALSAPGIELGLIEEDYVPRNISTAPHQPEIGEEVWLNFLERRSDAP